MTTVAYKEGVMACDSCHTDADVVVSLVTKIKRTSAGCLFGSAGDFDSRVIEELFDKVKHPSQIPSREALSKFDLDGRYLLVFKSERIWVIDIEPLKKITPGSSEAWEVSFPHYAIGSGGRWAWGAMDMGKSAKDAVRYACTRDIYSRPPIHVLPLHPVKLKV